MLFVHILYIYRVFGMYGPTRPEQVERTKLNRKVLYYFTMLAMINEILTFKDSRIHAFARLTIAEGTAHRAHGA